MNSYSYETDQLNSFLDRIIPWSLIGSILAFILAWIIYGFWILGAMNYLLWINNTTWDMLQYSPNYVKSFTPHPEDWLILYGGAIMSYCLSQIIISYKFTVSYFSYIFGLILFFFCLLSYIYR